MSWTVWTATAVALVAVSVATGAGAEPSTGDLARIQAIEASLPPAIIIEGRAPKVRTLVERMAETHVPGVSIAFFDQGGIVWTRTYGLADVASGRPVTTDTLFEAGSISKPVAAVAAMSLVQDGKLALDEDVNARLRDWKVPANAFTAQQKVTLRRLLSHTAGLTIHGFPGYARDKPLPTLDQILDGAPPANTAKVVVSATPGGQWVYSGGGYVIAQLLMTETDGTPFPDLARKRVLTPAGMAGSTYAQPLPDAMQARAATAYRLDGKPVPGGWHVYPEMTAAGLWTTPSDLARFAIAFQKAHRGQSSAMLSKASADEMLKPNLGDWGIGFGLRREAGMIQHGGVDEGFVSGFEAFTDGSGQGLVVMTNGQGGSQLIPDIVRAVAVAYDWPVLKPERVKLAVVPGETLAAYVGAYEIKGLARLTFTRQGDRLFVSTPVMGPAPIELLPQAPDAFFNPEAGVAVKFGQVTAGVAGGLKIKSGYGAFDAVRVP